MRNFFIHFLVKPGPSMTNEEYICSNDARFLTF